MYRVIGVILLDWNEIILRIYKKEQMQSIEVYSYKKGLRTSEQDFPITTAACKKTILSMLQKGMEFEVRTWKVCSRYLPKNKVQEISHEIGIDIEKLLLVREQELLCKGIVTET